MVNDSFQSYLTKILEPNSDIPSSDINYVFSGVASNVIGRDIAWTWMNAKWQSIHELFDNAVSSPVGSMVDSVTSDFNTQTDLAELLSFYQTNLHQLGTALSATRNAIVSTHVNIRWMENHYEDIRQWVADNKPDDDDDDVTTTTTTTKMTTTTEGNGAGEKAVSILVILIALSFCIGNL
jgi:hypothetical protein